MKRFPKSRFRIVVPGLAFVLLVWAAGRGMSPAAGPVPIGHFEGPSDQVCGAQAKDVKGARVWGDDAYARRFTGWNDCAACHEKGFRKGAGVKKIRGLVVDLYKEQWVWFRESPVWEQKDKHSQAYAVLLNERSKQMGKILGTEGHLDKRCLACHTGFPVNKMPAHESMNELMVSPKVQENLEVVFGVTCEGCHGPSGDRKEGDLKGWYVPHLDPDSWRFLAPETKREEFGFWDVRSPASRTKICVSCHIGSVEQGRVVTHEMYAAGHPPLPGFEVESFSRQMPEHWTRFSKKSQEAIDRFLKDTEDPIYKNGGYSKENLNHTRAMLAGALVTAGEYFRLVGDLAHEKKVEHVKDIQWPELAVFDCYACHHELKSESWRQIRKPPAGIPGRPFLQEWNTTFVEIALEQLGDASVKEYKTKFEAIRKALNRQPFGRPEELKTQTKAIADWLYERAVELERTPLTPERAPKLIKAVADMGATKVLDYDAARQAIWAMEVIDEDAKAPLGAEQIRKILNPYRVDKKTGQETKERMFLLDLHGEKFKAGREASAPFLGDDQRVEFTEVELDKIMPFIAEYDPLRFQRQFVQLRKLVK